MWWTKSAMLDFNNLKFFSLVVDQGASGRTDVDDKG